MRLQAREPGKIAELSAVGSPRLCATPMVAHVPRHPRARSSIIPSCSDAVNDGAFQHTSTTAASADTDTCPASTTGSYLPALTSFYGALCQNQSYLSLTRAERSEQTTGDAIRAVRLQRHRQIHRNRSTTVNPQSPSRPSMGLFRETGAHALHYPINCAKLCSTYAMTDARMPSIETDAPLSS